jgi:hypothetical protein
MSENRPQFGSISLESIINDVNASTVNSEPKLQGIPVNTPTHATPGPVEIPQAQSQQAPQMGGQGIDFSKLGNSPQKTQSVDPIAFLNGNSQFSVPTQAPVQNQFQQAPVQNQFQQAPVQQAPVQQALVPQNQFQSAPVQSPFQQSPQMPFGGSPNVPALGNSMGGQASSAFGGQPSQSSFIPVEFGSIIERYPINRDHFAQNFYYRRGIVSRNIFAVRYHNEQGLGIFFCFGGECCERNGAAQIRYIIPTIAYDADSTTLQIKSTNFNLGYFQLSEKQYKVLKATDLTAPFESMDYCVICTEEKFQTITIQSVGPAAWKTNQGMVDAVNRRYSEVSKSIAMSIGQTLTRDDYLRKIQQMNTFFANPGQAMGAGRGNNLSGFMR